ncbi:MAG: formate dehydrogenase accessory sulfurtransferase FdhD [Anaerolineae bacterium]|nr:formate dehydrogenase accessory sulfurtransferase FdhD [Anaerolineae bacterium]
MKRYRQPYRPEKISIPGIMSWSIHRVTEEGGEIVDGGVVVEEPLEIRVNGHPVAVLMRTPGMEKELAAGFCLGEGIVADLAHIALVQHCGHAVPDLVTEGDALDESRNRVDLRLMPGMEPPIRPEVASLIRSGCGRTDAAEMAEGLAPINGDLRVAAHVLPHLVGQMTRQQEAYRIAGGIHAAAVFDAHGRVVIVAEDIGRHNAVDKAMGYCLLRGIPLRDKIVMSTGRASYEMVAKGVRLGVPIVASISSPTSLAVELAEALNCTLLGYLRGKALNVYTHGWRIRDEKKD